MTHEKAHGSPAIAEPTPFGVVDLTNNVLQATPTDTSFEEEEKLQQTKTNTASEYKAGAGLDKSTSRPISQIKTKEEYEAEGYLTGFKLALCFTSLLMAIFLVSLDQTILSPALPVIASKFNALDNVGWIASAFFLTQAPFILFYGQLLQIARVKTVFMCAITLFEIGSLVCGVAPNVNVLIFGRAFAGVGAGGLFVCVLSIISQIIPLEKRPPFMGAFAAIWGASSVIGPLLGGVFTDHVTWRWCFYINLPIGGLSVLVVFLFLKSRPCPSELDENDTRLWWQKWAGLDWIGGFLLLGITTCLILALSWGGNQKPWNSAAVIACFCVFGALLPVFVFWQRHKAETAIFPLSFLKNRSLTGSTMAGFFMMLCLLSFMYYLPLQYQAVQGKSATASGIAILPFMMLVVGGGLIAGGATGATGHYWSWMVFPPLILSSIGGGLFYTVTATTSNAYLDGIQVLVGFGVGCALQQGQIAIQAEYSKSPNSIPQATAICSFAQLIGGVIGIAVAQVIFQNSLQKYLAPYGLSSILVTEIRSSVLVLKTLSADVHDSAIAAYVLALRDVYIMAVPAVILASVSAMFVKSHNVKKMGIEIGAGGA